MLKNLSCSFGRTYCLIFVVSCLLGSGSAAQGEPDNSPFEDEPNEDDGEGMPFYDPDVDIDGIDFPAALVASHVHGGSDIDAAEPQTEPPAPDEDAVESPDPVILSSGEFVHQESELDLRAPGVATLEFRRTYRSRSDLRSTLGSNWFHNHDIRVLWGRGATIASLPGACGDVEDTCIVLRREGADGIYLRPPGSSFYASLSGDGTALRARYEAVSGRPSGATLDFPDGATMTFDALGYISTSRDRFGNSLVYEYTASELDNAWYRLCRNDDAYPVPEGFPRRVCDTLHAALGERSPSPAEVDYADVSAPAGFTLNDVERVLFERLDEAALLYPAFAPSYCQGDSCVESHFMHRVSDFVHFPTMPPDGGPRRRLTHVRNHLGQRLTFTYFPWSERSAGLLQGVTGPALDGVAINFEYANPDDALLEKFHLDERTAPVRSGEWFLVSAKRRGTVFGVVEARRDVRYVYPWTRGDRMPLVEDYTDHTNQLHHTYFADAPMQARAEIDRLRSSALDNVVEIYVNDHDAVGERLVVRNQFDTNVNFKSGEPTSVFDRVVGQYYGGTRHLAASEIAMWADPTSANPAMAPELLGYALNNDPGSFSRPLSLRMTDGGPIGLFFRDMGEGHHETVVPERLRNRYDEIERPIDDIVITDASCRDVGVSVIDAALEPVPVTEAGHPIAVVTLLANDAARFICSWAQLTDRDGRIRWFGMNFTGMPLVSASWDQAGDDWIAVERVYAGNGELLEERWPVRANDGLSETKTVRSYSRMRQWSELEWRAHANLRSEVLFPRDVETTFISPEDGEDHLLLATSLALSYERKYNQLKHVLKYTEEPGVEHLAHEVVFDYECSPTPIVDHCAPGIAACDRIASFRALLDDLRFRLQELRSDNLCSSDCPSHLDADLKAVVVGYSAALRELDMHFAADELAPVETTLTGFSGFESTIEIDTYASRLVTSIDAITSDQDFAAEFEAARKVLDDADCQKAGACAKELAALEASVVKVSGTTLEDLQALSKHLPSGSADDLVKLSTGLLDVATIEARNLFYLRLSDARYYATKVTSSYTEKSRLEFIDDAIARVEAAKHVLDDVGWTLPRDIALSEGDIANSCGRPRHDVMHTGIPGDHRTTRFEWAASGEPLRVSQDSGVVVENSYANSGRGLLAATTSTLVDSDLASVMDVAACGAESDPYGWFLGGACAARGALEFGAEINAVMSDPGLRSRTISVVRDGLGNVTQTTDDGNVTTLQLDSWGRTLQTQSPGLRIATSVYAAGQVVTAIAGAYPAEHTRAERIYDAEGRILQECVELFEGGCSEYRTLTSSIDFASNDCDDVRGHYRDRVLPNALPEPVVQLTVVKRTVEGLPLCLADPSGRIQESIYDSLGRLTISLDYNSAERDRDDARVTEYRYDLDGQLIETTAFPSPSAGALAPLRETTRRDGLGRATVTRSPRGTIVTADYDHGGRLSRQSEHASDGGIGAPGIDVTSQRLDERGGSYDPHGQLIAVDINGLARVDVTYSRWGRAWRVERTGLAPLTVVTNIDGELLWRKERSGDEVVAGRDRVNHRTFESHISTDGATYRGLHSLSYEDADGFPTTLRSFGRGDDGVFLERTTSFVHDGIGALNRVIDPEGRVTTVATNSLGWPILTSVEHFPGTGVVDDVVRAYAANGQELSTIDPSGLETRYGLNGDGGVREALYPGGERIGWDVDGFGRQARVTLTDGTIIDDLFDDRGDLVERWSGGELLESFGHDELGRLTSTVAVNTIAGIEYPVTEQFVYDGLDRIVFDGVALGHAKPATVGTWTLVNGRWQRKLTLATGLATLDLHVDTHDGGGRVIARSGPDWKRTFEFNGAAVSGSYVGGAVVVDFASPRNAFGERVALQAIAPTSRHDTDLVRDRMGKLLTQRLRLTHATQTNEVWSGYTYGARARPERALTSMSTAHVAPSSSALEGRLAGAVADEIRSFGATLGASEVEWSRNTLGSPTTLKLDGVEVESWARGAGERLTAHVRDGLSTPIDHDPNHRVKTDGSYEFTFSPLDRLMTVKVGSDVVEGFAYTATGRLAGVIRNGAVDEVFVYDGDHQVASLTDSSAVRWTAAWGTRTNDLVRFENAGGDVFIPVLDVRGSIIGGWRDDGTWTMSTHHDEQGRQAPASGLGWCPSGQERCAFVADFPFGYTGAWVSQTGLLSLRHRWLSPALGQFLSVDPLEYVDSFNRFAYAGFDPINRVDPFGLDAMGSDGNPDDWDDDAPPLGEKDDEPDKAHVREPNELTDEEFQELYIFGFDLGANPPGLQFILLDGGCMAGAISDAACAGLQDGAKSTAGDPAALIPDVLLPGKGGKTTLKRPKPRQSLKDIVKENAPKDAAGNPIDPNTGLPLVGTPDLGHKHGHEFRREKKKAEAEGLTQEEFNERMNNPDLYQLENPSSNRSHKFEKPGDD